MLPEIAEMELFGAIAGVRPGTPDNLPLVGPGAVPGLVLATGHFRNGILLAPLTGDAIAAQLAGESCSFYPSHEQKEQLTPEVAR